MQHSILRPYIVSHNSKPECCSFMLGEMLWKCHSHQNPEKSSSPTSGKNLMAVDLVNDLNGDGTSDLLVIVSDPTNSILIAISGRSGELLWQHNLNLNCTQLSNLPAIDYIIHHPFCIINKGWKELFSRLTVVDLLLLPRLKLNLSINRKCPGRQRNPDEYPIRICGRNAAHVERA